MACVPTPAPQGHVRICRSKGGDRRCQSRRHQVFRGCAPGWCPKDILTGPRPPGEALPAVEGLPYADSNTELRCAGLVIPVKLNRRRRGAATIGVVASVQKGALRRFLVPCCNDRDAARIEKKGQRRAGRHLGRGVCGAVRALRGRRHPG